MFLLVSGFGVLFNHTIIDRENIMLFEKQQRSGLGIDKLVYPVNSKVHSMQFGTQPLFFFLLYLIHVEL